MKIKRFRWNVTILALFILLASALTWVLVALYMKNFIRYSDEISSYEKTSYLAKAGTELWLAIVGSREVWVVYSIASWNDLMSWNFECPYPLNDEWLCPQQPRFSLEINGLGSGYKNCDLNWESVTIKAWLSAIIPLFWDNSANITLNNCLSWGDYINRIKTNSPLSSTDWGERKFWVVWVQDDLLQMPKLWKWPASDVSDYENWDKAYLVIANPDTENSQSICVKWANIPQETVKLVSVGYFNWRQLWTETYATKALPDFLQGDNYLTNN